MFFGSDKDEIKNKYKFHSIKFYSSKEWMFNSTKKYRNVFEKNEVSYLYCEFSFFNKLFDEEVWDAKINLKAFSIINGKKKELCNVENKSTVSKEDNIVHIRESWGKDALGSFWTKGEYEWEAYIDGDLVGSSKFYFVDSGQVSSDNNPYFDVVSLKLYEGDSSGFNQNKKKYYSKFKTETTRYVWVELKLKNKIPDEWYCEIYYNFYDNAGNLKGQCTSLDTMEKDKVGTSYFFERGWGSNTPGTWIDECYRLDIVFMDHLIASTLFKTGDEFTEGDVVTSNASVINSETIVNETEESLEELLAKLENLIGLNNIKTQIKDHIEYINFIKLRKEKGFDDSEKISLHSVFTGNPGTGKTTVVKMLGKLYKKLGLLSNGEVHEVDRAALVAEYIGQTAPKVKEAISKARGGILFIDEAYSLAREDESAKDYGKEVIEILLKEMSDGEGNIAIMVAGYPQEMNIFLSSNPGLKSRFNYYFHFDDYTPDEMIKIAEFAANKRNITISDDANKVLSEIIISAYRDRDRSFGNARYIHSLVDEAKMNMGLRIMKQKDFEKLDKKSLSTILVEDIQKLVHLKNKKTLQIKIDEILLEESLTELNNLIGIQNIKTEVFELVKLIKYYNETGKDVMNKFSLHTVFTGNPGTGKTTVARIIGKVYKALGLLEKGHVLECDREALVAGFIGQTAIKTKAIIDSTMNGVLFIDEAYSLTQGNGNDFGHEAIEVILKNMEDKRGKFALIVAGYPQNMQQFLQSNPGLKSRFDRTMHFADYLPDDLFRIALRMFQKEDVEPNQEASECLQQYLINLYNTRDSYFGNARSVRTIVESIIRKQNIRMAELSSEMRTMEMTKIIAIEDLKSLPEHTKPTRKTIGF